MANKDQVKGAGKEIKGKVQEEVGKATDDEELQIKGKGKQIEGKVQRKVGEVKEDLKKAL